MIKPSIGIVVMTARLRDEVAGVRDGLVRTATVVDGLLEHLDLTPDRLINDTDPDPS